MEPTLMLTNLEDKTSGQNLDKTVKQQIGKMDNLVIFR